MVRGKLLHFKFLRSYRELGNEYLKISFLEEKNRIGRVADSMIIFIVDMEWIELF